MQCLIHYLLTYRIQENLCRAEDKNDALLEAIETAEARALDTSSPSSSETSLLRNLRARLAASHAPNALLKKDLNIISGIIYVSLSTSVRSSIHCIEEVKERFESLTLTLKLYRDLNIKLQQEEKDMDEQQRHLDREREHFEEEREKWKRDLEQARTGITEQNDRLALLSQQLTGTKVQYIYIFLSSCAYVHRICSKNYK